MQEKSRGILIFAFDTDQINYVKIAEQSARLAKHFLNLPVTLITDQLVDSDYFDNVICIDNSLENYRTGMMAGSSWRNGERYQAYQLSPYDETILLDSDYLVLDTHLLKLLDVVEDYGMPTKNTNLNCISMDGLMGMLSLPYVWATVVLFKKTPRAQTFFEFVGRIQRNYPYYQQLYQIRESNYRNDYAFAMANNVLNGYTTGPDNEIKMLTADQNVKSIESQSSRLVIRTEDRAVVLPRQSLHVMDKTYLLSQQHGKFVDKICQE